MAAPLAPQSVRSAAAAAEAPKPNCVLCFEEFSVEPSGSRMPIGIPCGHSFCRSCVKELVSRARGLQLHCPVCRATHVLASIDPQRFGTANYALMDAVEGHRRMQAQLDAKVAELAAAAQRALAAETAAAAAAGEVAELTARAAAAGGTPRLVSAGGAGAPTGTGGGSGSSSSAYSISSTSGTASSAKETAERDREPMLLMDVTGSMIYQAFEGKANTIKKRDMVRQALNIIVPYLAEQDSKAGEEEDGGGLRCVTFAGGKAQDLGDLSPDNLEDKWKGIKWNGGTQIMPGWLALVGVYLAEFGMLPAAERPLLMAVIITDGEADDNEAFATAISRMPDYVYVVIGVVGHGEEYDKALSTYAAAASGHVRVLAMCGPGASPRTIAETLIAMVQGPVATTGWL